MLAEAMAKRIVENLRTRVSFYLRLSILKFHPRLPVCSQYLVAISRNMTYKEQGRLHAFAIRYPQIMIFALALFLEDQTFILAKV